MGKPSAPRPPDYAAAAREQGEANVEAARATAQLNNPNVFSPYGTQTVTYQGDIPTVTQTFSPEQQALYERNNRVQQMLADLGIEGAGVLGDVIGSNIDFGTLPAGPGTAGDTRQKVIDAMMGRANTQFAQREDDTRSQLVAQGIRPGTEAYDREMTRIDQARNDARQQAEIAAGGEASRDFGMDTERRRAALAELLAGRQTPLNEISALMSGSQVTNPFAQVGGYQGGAVTQPSPLFQGTQAQWNADMDRYNQQAAQAGGLTSGLFQLGSAALMASDRRLKRNIRLIGKTAGGHNWYAFEYLWGEPSVGVMADEVMHTGAVIVHPSGYLMVNYGMLR